MNGSHVTEVQTRVRRVGGRRWVERTAWQGRGTRWVRVVRTEKRRVGWESGRWVEVRNGRQRVGGVVESEVWS